MNLSNVNGQNFGNMPVQNGSNQPKAQNIFPKELNAIEKADLINPSTINGQNVDSAKKDTKKKIIIGTAIISTVALAVLAIVKRKDLAELAKKIKNKGADVIGNIKAKYTKNVGPEEIVLPKNGSYDLSKEANCVGYTTNCTQTGFKNYQIKPENEKSLSKTLSDIQSNGKYADVGITRDGHAYIGIGTENGIGVDLPDAKYEKITDIHILSNNSEFTPAQKNLFAILHQDKINSQNSPMAGVLSDLNFENPTREDLFDLIAKWSKDIDVNNQETKEALGVLSTFKKGSGARIQDISGEGIKNVISLK